jgi:hypothetical protein
MLRNQRTGEEAAPEPNSAIEGASRSSLQLLAAMKVQYVLNQLPE